MKQLDHWWKDAIFYEIYLRSFQDSNGDGIGDLRGIIQRLDYLQDLGVDALWICPFYQSPQVDFGYDIADYRKVDPIFGTNEDFLELLGKALKIHDCRLIAFCLMSSHVHLVAQLGQDSIGKLTKQIHSPFATWIHQQRRRGEL